MLWMEIYLIWEDKTGGYEGCTRSLVNVLSYKWVFYKMPRRKCSVLAWRGGRTMISSWWLWRRAPFWSWVALSQFQSEEFLSLLHVLKVVPVFLCGIKRTYQSVSQMFLSAHGCLESNRGVDRWEIMATGGWGSKATGLVHVYSNGKGLLNDLGDTGQWSLSCCSGVQRLWVSGTNPVVLLSFMSNWHKLVV